MAPLIHHISENARPQPIHFSDEFHHRTLAEDCEIIERIIAAYHRALESAAPEVRRLMCGTIWGEQGVIGKQGGLVQALASKSPAGVHDILRGYFYSDASFGIAMGPIEGELVRNHPEHRSHYGFMWLDRLVTLAKAGGAIPLVNPEDSFDRWRRSLEAEPEQLFRAIEEQIGIPLRFPNVCGAFGGEIRGEAFPFIAFTHLLVALQTKSLAAVDEPTIYEIGGGFGGAAYFAAQLMSCRYTIFDLPFINAVQAYFLHRALPGRRLVLWGEPATSKPHIALAPGWALINTPSGTSIDILVNQDSMPEMPQEAARGYLDAGRRILSGFFLSVNQEPAPHSAETWNRTSVARLVESVGGYTRLLRCPFFLRTGYVQEVYYPTAAGRRHARTRFRGARTAGPRRTPVRTAFRLVRQGDFRGIGQRVRSRVGTMFRAFM